MDAINNIIKTISETIEKLYRSFIIRDMLGLVLPGALFLFLLSNSLISCYPNKIFNWLNVIGKNIAEKKPPDSLEILALFGIAYLNGWILQCVHYGFANFIGCLKNREWGKNINSEYISHYLTTRWALEIDKEISKIKTEGGLKILDEKSAPYTERVTALTLMTGNIATGISILFLINLNLVKQRDGCIKEWVTVILVLLCVVALYFEHWRLWKARNLRHIIYIDIAQGIESKSKDDKSSAS